jgi:hypothetical protein
MRTEWRQCDSLAYFRRHRRVDQDLSVLGRAADSRRQIHDATNRGLFVAAFVADAADGSRALCEADPEANRVAA